MEASDTGASSMRTLDDVWEEFFADDEQISHEMIGVEFD